MKQLLIDWIHLLDHTGLKVEVISLPKDKIDQLIRECATPFLDTIEELRKAGSPIKFMGVEIREKN